MSAIGGNDTAVKEQGGKEEIGIPTTSFIFFSQKLPLLQTISSLQVAASPINHHSPSTSHLFRLEANKCFTEFK